MEENKSKADRLVNEINNRYRHFEKTDSNGIPKAISAFSLLAVSVACAAVVYIETTAAENKQKEQQRE